MVGAMRVFVVLLLALPAATAVVVALLGPKRQCAIRWLCLTITLVDAVLASVLAVNLIRHRKDHHGGPEIQGKFATFQPEFVPGALQAPPIDLEEDAGPEFKAKLTAFAERVTHKTTWSLLRLGDVGAVQFYLGVDGINIWLVLLTAILMVPAVLVSWKSIGERTNEYYAWLLALGAGMTGVFLAFDIILFYVFFELTLVPLFFLIGIWGGPERRHAARKFFIYTLAGSLVTFLGLLAVVVVCYQKPVGPTRLTFAIPELVQTVNVNLAATDNIAAERQFWQSFQFWVFLALLTGFAIKVPLFPVHTWLPLAHTEAPTAGSVLLAGVLLKLGAYGILRFCLPLTPDACISVGVPLVGTLAVVGIVYGAFCALAQSDIKKLVAYSSVSHLGFCMLGMFALNSEGLAGSLLQMINHGLSTGALFLLVGMLYERYHTRQLSDYGGMGTRLPRLSVCMVFIALSSIGLPGLNGFVGEALVFFGMFKVRPMLTVWATAGILLGAWYLLSMVRQVFFGRLKEPHHDGEVSDLGVREMFALGPIMVLCLVLGVFPQPVLDTARPDLDVIVNILKQRPVATGL